MNKLASLSSLFSNDKKIQRYYLVKLFPFLLKGDAKVWFNSLSYCSIKKPHELLDVFFAKYFPAHMQHAALQRIYNFKQLEDEHLPKAWGRFCSLLRARPVHGMQKNELIDIFYNGLTVESRTYLDSCAGCVFRKRTVAEPEEDRKSVV